MGFQLIKADDLEKEVLKESEDKLQELLKKIDQALRASAKSSGSGYVNATVSTEGFNKFVIDKAIEICYNAGWIAQFSSDQRDGNYIAIKKNTKKEIYVDNYREFAGYLDR